MLNLQRYSESSSVMYLCEECFIELAGSKKDSDMCITEHFRGQDDSAYKIVCLVCEKNLTSVTFSKLIPHLVTTTYH